MRLEYPNEKFQRSDRNFYDGYVVWHGSLCTKPPSKYSYVYT